VTDASHGLHMPESQNDSDKGVGQITTGIVLINL